MEYRELIESHNRVKADASEIRDFLLAVLADAQNGVEKFGDDRLLEAREIIDRVGPGAFYWMTDIAAQMVLLSTAKFNEVPTSVDIALKAPVKILFWKWSEFNFPHFFNLHRTPLSKSMRDYKELHFVGEAN